MTILERMSDAGRRLALKRTPRSPLSEVRAGDLPRSQRSADGERMLPVMGANENTKRSLGWKIDPASAGRWAKVISTAQAQSAGVIGISGIRPGVGATLVSRELAAALAGFGKKTLYIDLSDWECDAPPTQEESAGDNACIPIPVDNHPLLYVAEFDVGKHRWRGMNELRSAFALAVRPDFTVVVDLPAVLLDSGAPSLSLAAAGSLCDLVFLVCLSGETTQKDIELCGNTCTIAGPKLGGLILNDWRMPGSQLLG